EKENIFCNTLVDRIVTGYPKGSVPPEYNDDRMLDTCELFHLWVIEGYSGLFEELPLDKAGLNVVLTNDITPYRTRKVRILNGAHTSIIPYAILSGVKTVRECMHNEQLLSHLKACVFDEIIPSLDMPNEQTEAYARSVLERFDNPYINHLCSSIALNSVSKFKVRILPSIIGYINLKNEMPEHLLFSFSKLIDFYHTDMVDDDAETVNFMRKASVGEILSNTSIWGMNLSFLRTEVEKYADS
ncbi:MAG: tagaturonate reductase, partial [Eubacteriales bacterium]